MNVGVSKPPFPQTGGELSKSFQEALLDTVADTSAEVRRRQNRSPLDGILSSEVPATKRKRDTETGISLPAKRAHWAQTGPRQPGAEDKELEQVAEMTVQQPKPIAPGCRYAPFLKDFIDPDIPHDFGSTVLEWLKSVGSDREDRCRSDSHLQRPLNDLILRNLARSAPETGYTPNAYGFVVSPTPVSARSRPYTIDEETGSIAPSDVTGSGRSSSRSLVEDPHYRRRNLAVNHIYMRHPCDPIPEHIAELVDLVRQDRDSPGPSPDTVNQDRSLFDLSMGVGEHDVEKYFHAHIFPAPDSSDVLQCSYKTPVGEHIVPSAGSRLKVSTPVPDMLYGYRDGAFTLQPHLVSMGAQLFANTAGLLYPFFVVEFKGDGGSMWVATNQCLGASMSCVKMAEDLNRRLMQCRSEKVQLINNASFSIATNGTEARLYVSWKHDELDYYMANVKSFLLQEPEHYIEFRKCVRNILDWGKDKRLNQIRDSLDILLEEGRRRAAKSHPPYEEFGKKLKSSSSRENSSISSSAKGQAHGGTETDWGLDNTTQEVNGETTYYLDQQRSVAVTDDYTESKDIDEESALPNFYLANQQQGKGQPVVSLGSSAETTEGFERIYTSSFTTSFSLHGHDIHSRRPTP